MAYNNIGKLFFREYYDGVDFSFVISNYRVVGQRNKAKVKTVNDKVKQSALIPIVKPTEELRHTFQATILYPGLITGVGLVHNSKGIEGGYNLGMHFDYTTGMPIVYGSSVKGVLRSYFDEFDIGNINREKLKNAIFDGKDSKGGPLPMYKRDIFFDAVITEEYKHDKRQPQFLVDDSITPHTEGPLKDPLPIAMLKIAAGCTIEFRFLLRDTEIDGNTLRADKKLELFKQILGTVGIGAKTNVGYGQLKMKNV